MGHWNYRLYKYSPGKTGPGDIGLISETADPVYCIQETYYNDDGKPCGRTEGYELLIHAETDEQALEEFKGTLNQMLRDLEKAPVPLVDFEEWAPSGLDFDINECISADELLKELEGGQ